MSEGLRNNVQSSEKKAKKYDRMLHSLEAMASKQRKTPNKYGSAKKTVTTNDATDALQEHLHMDNRTAALSISSCFSKNTGSLTQLWREKQGQIHACQQLAFSNKHPIFDRNRPWNCEFCQQKSQPLHLMDKKLREFNHRRVAIVVSRFMIKEEFYESRKVLELLSTSSRSLLVAYFKDYLIYDDIYEFLTSCYNLQQSLEILTRHAVFYDSLSQLDVLAQYREDQIRDRHLVLHGLKPCYVGLEKQIQAIIASNLRNKLRLVLNKVKKVQLARGIMTDVANDENQDDYSQYSTPLRATARGQQRACPNRPKKTFKKLIQSSMVREYNFTRSQSGLLVAKETVMADGPLDARKHLTNMSINFENISFEREVVLLKGSVFDDSMTRQTADVQNHQLAQGATKIDSMYINAQIILDDLSSRPLTRQSVPKINTASSTSRIHLYNLYQQEEQKLRLPFLAPEKPNDQRTDYNNTSSLILTQDEIMIVNQGQRHLGRKKDQSCPHETQLSPRSGTQPSAACHLRVKSATKEPPQIEFKPFVLPSNNHSLNTSLDSQESCVEMACSQTQSAKKQQRRPVQMPVISQGDFNSLKKTSASKREAVECTKRQTGVENQTSERTFRVKGVSAAPHGQSQKSESQQDRLPHGASQEHTLGSGGMKRTQANLVLQGRRQDCLQRQVPPPPLDDQVPTTDTAPQARNWDMEGKASLQLTARMIKANSVKSNLQQQAQQQSTVPNGQQVGKVTDILAKKKASLPKGALCSLGDKQKLSLQEELANLSHRLFSHQQHSSQRAEEAESQKIKVSKKLIASIKKTIVENNPRQNDERPQSPNQLDSELSSRGYEEGSIRWQTSTVQCPKQKGKVNRPLETEGNQGLHQSPKVLSSRRIASKVLTPAKTMSHLGTKSFLTVQQQMVQLQQPHLQRNSGYKVLKTAVSGSKKGKEMSKQSSSRIGVVAGSSPSVFYPDAATQLMKASNDPQQLTLKEQVLLKALRHDQGQRTASGGPQHPQTFISHAPALQAQHVMRSQQVAVGSGFLSQAKSMVSQKVDLNTIAGKLKMLNHPSKVPNSASAFFISHTASRQRLLGSSIRKNSFKFNSRKGSNERCDENIQFQENGSSAQTCKQMPLRFFSADGYQGRSSNETSDERLEHSARKTTEQGPKTRSQRKLKQPQQVEAFESQRQFGTLEQTASPLDQAKTSRNQILVEMSSANDLRQAHTQHGKISFSELRKQESRPRVQKLLQPGHQPKKKIQKLSRAITGPLTDTKSQGEAAIQVVSPRKQMNDNANALFDTAKTRNANLGASQTTQLRMKLQLGNNNNLKQQLLQQTLTTPKQNPSRRNQPQQHPNSAASTFEQAVAQTQASKHHQPSRNSGLPVTHVSQKLPASFKDCNLASSSKQTALARNLGSHQQLPPALSFCSPSMSQTTLKQELKLHSRKNSAVLSKQCAGLAAKAGISHQGSGPIAPLVTKHFSTVISTAVKNRDEKTTRFADGQRRSQYKQ